MARVKTIKNGSVVQIKKGMPTRYWAIGMKGLFVELRRSSTTPKKEVTTAEIPSSMKRLYFDATTGNGKYRLEKFNYKLTTVSWSGGRTVKYVPVKYFVRVGVRCPSKDACVELQPSVAALLLKECNREKRHRRVQEEGIFEEDGA